MSCTDPRKGFRSKTVNASGKRSIVFNQRDGFADMPVTIACGQCIHCRLENSRQWAIRCVHEASFWPQNCFITLTYNSEHLPKDASLHVRDFQLFMKRLRKSLHPKRIKYKHCGEYGDKHSRPHYHALLFNHDFSDKIPISERDGYTVYTSQTLEEIWGRGQVQIGELNFKTAAYVARYITKKINGKGSEIYYDKIDEKTGEVFSLKKEYSTGSQGIGRGWIQKYLSDVFPHDFVVLKNKKQQAPKYYLNQLKKINPNLLKKIEIKRKLKALDKPQLSWERLKTIEDVTYLKLSTDLKRRYEKCS